MNVLNSSVARPRSRPWVCGILAVGVVVAVGCSGTDSNRPDDRVQQEVGAIELLVVDDPTLAATIRREWRARGTGELVVRETDAEDLLKSESLGADALIYPSALVGELAERGFIVPVPADVLGSETLAWRDVFRLIRVQESTWGEKTYGLPLGSPQLVLYYRGDVFDRLGISPPQTWQQYQQVLEKLSAHKADPIGTPDPEGSAAPEADPIDASPDALARNADLRTPGFRFAAVEPLGPGWAGQVLLARAAAYARHRNQYSTLFDYTTMRPLVDGPPFVRALEELVAAAEHGPPQPWTITPEMSRQRFWNSEVAMALSWPTRSGSDEKAHDATGHGGGAPDVSNARGTRAPGPAPNVKIAALPGSVEVYQFLNESWELRNDNEPQYVPLLAIAGRTGSVARQTPRPRRAFALLAWLGGREWSGLISPASSATTLFRTTHVPVSRRWLPAQMDETTGRDYADLVETTQSSPTWFITLRLPGRAEYMAALDGAVHQALRKEIPPEQALHEVAVTWNSITDRFGRQRQRDAYQRSIGVGP